ncbi:MAG: 23S rRNA (uracil(1939)-C(5))-methyltransferase RlmD [Bacteroidetes bacterium]|nr:MAG: 23S rRNA (uracil(1939)-C(5))-methyltransferase RlmD [Bacteroidota bacterium]MBL1144377.1 23S rRNA (uracil(1939)-C(5))-methyltransferase RlmD [Bacteroidota bacterium]NOG57173.1 23S rRNA (uracil(1939)-C(5))-methyltransferase RlmD [Bacteroidota bacterium]
MGRKSRKPFYEQVEILDTAAEGKSLAKIDEKVIFIAGTVPGDIVDVQVFRKRKKFMEGRVTKFHKYSEKRVTPFCEHFGVCGGCKWQFISYQDQLDNKHRTVIDCLTRMAKVELPEINRIFPSTETQFYRNKMEYTFSNKEWLTLEQINSDVEFGERNALGFHVPGMFDKVLNITKCWLQADPSNAIRNWIYNFCIAHKFPFFDLREQNGLMRNIIIRTSSNGEIMVIFVFAKEDQEARIKILEAFQKQFPEVTSLMYVINEKRNDTIADQEIIAFNDRDHIFEEMKSFDGQKLLKFKIGPKSFYQTNSKQAAELYRIAAEFAQIQKDELVYDLYTGTGTIANYVASQAKHVVGVEYVEDAIIDAKVNAAINEIENTSFYAGDMKDVLNDDFIAKNGKPDVIITDPPRAGMHEDVIQMLLKLEADRIVYVSCNPGTQARDIHFLDAKYKVMKVQPVDMFPQTHHVENVVLLKRK